VTAGGEGGGDWGDDRPPVPRVPEIDEATAVRRLDEASAALVDGVGRALPGWAARSADELLAAWDRLDLDRRREVVEAAREAGERAARRVSAEGQEGLRAFLEKRASAWSQRVVDTKDTKDTEDRKDTEMKKKF